MYKVNSVGPKTLSWGTPEDTKQRLDLCSFKTVLLSRCKVTRNQTFYLKLSSRKRGNSPSEFHRNSLKYRKDQRGKLD